MPSPMPMVAMLVTLPRATESHHMVPPLTAPMLVMLDTESVTLMPVMVQATPVTDIALVTPMSPSTAVMVTRSELDLTLTTLHPRLSMLSAPSKTPRRRATLVVSSNSCRPQDPKPKSLAKSGVSAQVPMVSMCTSSVISEEDAADSVVTTTPMVQTMVPLTTMLDTVTLVTSDKPLPTSMVKLRFPRARL